MADHRDYTDDEKWLVVDGRRWRRTDPELPAEVVDELKSHLGRARNAVKAAKKTGDEDAVRAARERVNLSKHGLGERGEKWWEHTPEDRLRRADEALAQLNRS